MTRNLNSLTCIETGFLNSVTAFIVNALLRAGCHMQGPGGALARRASFFYHYPPVPVFAPTLPNNLEYLLAVSKNWAHPLHPVHDDGKGGGWKWWE